MNVENPMMRLAVGSHKAGSGLGCAMNVQSWINGDKEITDYPDCADPALAGIVQIINDSHCTHRNESKLLCAPCSVEVLDLSNKTVGTRLDSSAATAVYRSVALRLGFSFGPLICTDSCCQPDGEFAKRFGAAPFYFVKNYTTFRDDGVNVLGSPNVEVSHNGVIHYTTMFKYTHEERSAMRMESAHKLLDTFRALAGVGTPAPKTEQIEEAVTKMAVVA